MQESDQGSYESGRLLLVNKPIGWTSFDVVNKIRYALKRKLGVKKIKVGHAGTLDPMATGLLLICTGSWTKKISSFQDMGKTYTGSMLLGAVTPSYDAETDVIEEFPFDHISEGDVTEALKKFQGEIEQIPPVFSAIKVDGKPLYHYARKGREVEIKSRMVTIHDFHITNSRIPELEFYVQCSKGTYIRSLVHDLGKALGSGAYMTALQRGSVGPYKLEDAWEINALIMEIESGVTA